MTLADILQGVSLDYDFQGTQIASSDSDYARRVALANRYADEWAARRQGRWVDLFTSTTLTTNGTVTLALPADLSPNDLILKNNGTLYIDGKYYQIIPAQDFYRYTTSENYTAWVTGNIAVGFTLNFNVAPTSGVSFTIYYYSTYLATDTNLNSQLKLIALTDISKCPRPRFIIYSILSALYRVDEDMDYAGRSAKFEQLAEAEMVLMLASENVGEINQTSAIESIADINGYPPIGK